MLRINTRKGSTHDYRSVVIFSGYCILHGGTEVDIGFGL